MGVMAVGRMLRHGVNEGTITWLGVGYAHDVDCDCFAVVIMTDDRTNAPSSPDWLIWHWGNHDCSSGSVGQTRWNLRIIR